MLRRWRLYRQMKRELDRLIWAVESGRNVIEARSTLIWCTSCQDFHPRYKPR